MSSYTDSEILKALKASEEASRWVSEEYDKLRREYEGKVLAVKDKGVICQADTVEGLLDKLQDMNENVALLLIESVPPRNLSFIL